MRRARQQSPIDITAPISARQPLLRISWSKRPDTIVNNGHTIQLDFAEGDTSTWATADTR